MLPAALAPPAPFPLVVAQSVSRAFVAPGATLVTYHLATSRGALVVRALAVDPRERTIRVSAVLAHDILVSQGETVSSMARRTGAVAGINADYFDIGQTNQPLNMVVRDGMLLRTPSGRAVISFLRERGVRFGTYRFSGSVSDAGRTWQVEGVGEWPPQGGGAMLERPAFGAPLPAATGVTFVQLQPQAVDSRTLSGDVRVLAVNTGVAPCAACLVLAFGVRAGDVGALPVQGDVIHVEAATDPSLDGVAAAVGGGPLLVRAGSLYDDPDPPSPAEALQRDPQSGAIRSSDGSFALLEVDGRAGGVSVGLTRPELAALMLSFGAIDGMAFDSGGSATMAARMPGDAHATLVSVPSDGHERNVADGLFIYSDAPRGLPARLAVRPAAPTVLAGATVAVTTVPTDLAGHPAGAEQAVRRASVDPPALARMLPDGRLLALAPGSGTLRVRRGALLAAEPIRVVASLATLRIMPQEPNPDAGRIVAFEAIGSDASGAPVAVADRVRWRVGAGTIAADGRYVAGRHDTTVTASAGGRQASARVRVGRSEGVIDAFSAHAGWRFFSVPKGAPGSASVVAEGAGPPVLELAYDFSSGARAAYAETALALPGAPLSLSLDVRGDGTGAGLRAAFDNADGDRIAVTLVRRVGWRGWRRCSVRLPATAVPPLRLRALYAVAALSGSPVRGAGTLAFRDLRATFAGSGAP